MRSTTLISLLLLACATARAPATATEGTAALPDGVLAWTPAAPGATLTGEVEAARWGMYQVQAQLAAPAGGALTVGLLGRNLAATADGSSTTVILGTVYIAKDGKQPVTVAAVPADAARPLVVTGLQFVPACEGVVPVQAEDRSITLHAHDATVHGAKLRYEIRPDKNTLGYWADARDWVGWQFELKQPGRFIVVAMQGSSGGSQLELSVGGQRRTWTTKDSGGNHTFTFLEVGTVSLDQPGTQTLTLRPLAKVGGAIMDLRMLMLLPILK